MASPASSSSEYTPPPVVKSVYRDPDLRSTTLDGSSGSPDTSLSDAIATARDKLLRHQFDMRRMACESVVTCQHRLTSLAALVTSKGAALDPAILAVWQRLAEYESTKLQEALVIDAEMPPGYSTGLQDMRTKEAVLERVRAFASHGDLMTAEELERQVPWIGQMGTGDSRRVQLDSEHRREGWNDGEARTRG